MIVPTGALIFWSLGLIWTIKQSFANDLYWAEFALRHPGLVLPSHSVVVDDTLNASFSDLSTYGNIQCFQNPPPPAPPAFGPVITYDYLELLESLVVADDATRNTQKTFAPGDFKQITSGGCTLSVGVTPSQTASTIIARYRQTELAHVTAKIAQECLVAPNSVLGGTLRFGPGLQLLVVLGASGYNSKTTATL